MDLPRNILPVHPQVNVNRFLFLQSHIDGKVIALWHVHGYHPYFTLVYTINPVSVTKIESRIRPALNTDITGNRSFSFLKWPVFLSAHFTRCTRSSIITLHPVPFAKPKAIAMAGKG